MARTAVDNGFLWSCVAEGKARKRVERKRHAKNRRVPQGARAWLDCIAERRPSVRATSLAVLIPPTKVYSSWLKSALQGTVAISKCGRDLFAGISCGETFRAAEKWPGVTFHLVNS